MLFLLFLSWCCHLVRGGKDVLKPLAVVESVAGKQSQAGSCCPGWSGQGEEGAPAGCWRLLALADSGKSHTKCGLVAFIYLLAF